MANTTLGFLGVEEFIDPAIHIDEAEEFVPKDDPLAAELGTIHNSATGQPNKPRRPKPLPVYHDNVCRRVFLPRGLIYFSCCSLRSAEMEPAQLLFLESTSWDLVPPPPAMDGPQDGGGGGEAVHNATANGGSAASDALSSQSYVRLAVSRDHRIVEAVHYYGRDHRELYNFRSLVGMSEATLNLCYNHFGLKEQQAKTLDAQRYVRSPWARAVFADTFPDLMATIRQQFVTHPETRQAMATLRQSLRSNAAATVADEDRGEVMKRLTDPSNPARQLVELELLKFLHQQKAFTPQIYFLPDITEHAA